MSSQSIDQTSPSTKVIRKLIPGFVGYFAAEDGTIWSARSSGGKPRKVLLKRSPTVKKRGGYLFLTLRPTPGSRSVTCHIHRLVLETFVGPCPEGMTACHNDGNPANNALSNLRWDTPENNHADKRLHGTYQCGSQIASARLNSIRVQAVRVLHAAGWSSRRIATLFGVVHATILCVINGGTWGHVSDDDNVPD